jgi:hypothetical protein
LKNTRVRPVKTYDEDDGADFVPNDKAEETRTQSAKVEDADNVVNIDSEDDSDDDDNDDNFIFTKDDEIDLSRVDPVLHQHPRMMPRPPYLPTPSSFVVSVQPHHPALSQPFTANDIEDMDVFVDVVT